MRGVPLCLFANRSRTKVFARFKTQNFPGGIKIQIHPRGQNIVYNDTSPQIGNLMTEEEVTTNQDILDVAKDFLDRGQFPAPQLVYDKFKEYFELERRPETGCGQAQRQLNAMMVLLMNHSEIII